MSELVQKAKKGPPDQLPFPDKAEIEATEAARDRLRGRHRRLTTQIQTGKNGDLDEIGPEHADKAGWLARLQDIFGTNGRYFALSEPYHILVAARRAEGGYDAAKVNSLIAAMEDAKPQTSFRRCSLSRW